MHAIADLIVSALLNTNLHAVTLALIGPYGLLTATLQAAGEACKVWNVDGKNREYTTKKPTDDGYLTLTVQHINFSSTFDCDNVTDIGAIMPDSLPGSVVVVLATVTSANAGRDPKLWGEEPPNRVLCFPELPFVEWVVNNICSFTPMTIDTVVFKTVNGVNR